MLVEWRKSWKTTWWFLGTKVTCKCPNNNFRFHNQTSALWRTLFHLLSFHLNKVFRVLNIMYIVIFLLKFFLGFPWLLYEKANIIPWHGLVMEKFARRAVNGTPKTLFNDFRRAVSTFHLAFTLKKIKFGSAFLNSGVLKQHSQISFRRVWGCAGAIARAKMTSLVTRHKIMFSESVLIFKIYQTVMWQNCLKTCLKVLSPLCPSKICYLFTCDDVMTLVTATCDSVITRWSTEKNIFRRFKVKIFQNILNSIAKILFVFKELRIFC